MVVVVRGRMGDRFCRWDTVRPRGLDPTTHMCKTRAHTPPTTESLAMPDEIKSYVGQKGVLQAEFFHLDAEVRMSNRHHRACCAGKRGRRALGVARGL